MIEPKGITEQLLYSTVRIEADNPSGTSVGTGFHFRFGVDEDRNIPVVVTCKHVVAGCSRGRFKMHMATDGEPSRPTGESRFIELDNFEQRWVPHPDAEVDLCAMPIAPLLTEAQQRGLRLFSITLDERLLPTDAELEQMQTVESILMVGYPTGLWDEVNNFPLFRRGITATHPAVDYQGKSITIIDAACFPGSSGSPVLIADEGAFGTKTGVVIGTRVKLLGVLFQGPTFTAHGDIVIENIPTAQRASALTSLMIHLGFVIKAKELNAIGSALRHLAAGASA
jgi:hypothetical protein